MRIAQRCPKCDVDISESYEQDDPDTGIVAGWFCEACDLPVRDDDPGYDEYDDAP